MYPTVQEPPCQVHAVHVTIVMNTALLHVLAPLMSITALYRFWHVLQLKILVFYLQFFYNFHNLKCMLTMTQATRNNYLYSRQNHVLG